MVNAKKTSFAVTKVAKNGLALGVALMCIQDLEKEVSRLRLHVSVLLKRLNGRGKKEKIVEEEEVAERVVEAEVAEVEVEAEVAAVGVPSITSHVYKVVAEKEDMAVTNGD